MDSRGVDGRREDIEDLGGSVLLFMACFQDTLGRDRGDAREESVLAFQVLDILITITSTTQAGYHGSSSNHSSH